MTEMSIEFTEFLHYIKIDHWEKDSWDNTFMIDCNGGRWHMDWRGKNLYSFQKVNINRIVKVRKQKEKVIRFITFMTDDPNQGYNVVGKTMTYQDAAKEFLQDHKMKLAKDSYNTILELLLLN